MASKRKYYAVVAGHKPGIYETWAECEHQVKGFKGQKYKSFPSKAEADLYLQEGRSLQRINTLENRKPQLCSSSNLATTTEVKADLLKNPFKNYTYQLSSSVLEMAPADYEERVERVQQRGTILLDVDPASKEKPAKIGTHLTKDLESVADVNAMYQLEYDGASKGNPGAAGAGALLRHPDGTVICEVSVGLGKATNNVAEYRGLIAGMRKALDLGIQRIQAQGDSKLVTMQVRGKWKINNDTLTVLCKEAVALLKNFKDFQIRHVDREWNSAADALANKGVGLPEEKFVSTFAVAE